MKTKMHSLVIGLALLACVPLAGAQNAQFFRIVGPTATTITAFNTDGTIVWSGANPGATYQVQTATSLAGDSNWVDYVQLPGTNYVNTNLLVSFNPPPGMALIPAGVFRIGDTLDGESDAVPTNVYVSSFYMDTDVVSFDLWQGVYNYATNNGYNFLDSGLGNAGNQPVVKVTWYDCVRWCNARSQQAGLTPVYYTDAGLTQVFTNANSPLAMYANWSANGYRLPTEAEWEKAARGGLIGLRFPWGNTISESQANYYAVPSAYGISFGDLGPYTGYNTNFDSGNTPYTSPVDYFAPNGYGLHDMAGNVYQWCWDWYSGAPYPAGSPYLGGTDPTGPGAKVLRVMRGGPWDSYATVPRCAARHTGIPPASKNDIGFRCVKGL